MSCCTFFGHGDYVCAAKETIKKTVENTIIDDGADVFYVGNNGSFDRMVITVLTELKKVYDIEWFVVIPYPNSGREYPFDNTLYPEGLETTPRRYCIDKRNLWMINRSDIVITHIVRPCSRAEKYKNAAEKKGKKVYNIV
ncbi:MAG: hypothetical protein IJQ80_05045 [Clostridia bacterium]|nr:hypothetical protein [Clostridia bacterium]